MSSSNPRRSGNPARRASAGQAPDRAGGAAAGPSSRPPGAREAVNQRSRGVLVRLSRLPALVIPGLVLMLMVVGLSAPLPVALPALGLIALFVGWLAYISWPILQPRGRFTRGLMLGIVLGSAVARVQGWL